METTQIIRTYTNCEGILEEFEIAAGYRVEHKHYGSEEPDDPSECCISEHVKVLEDTGPFKKGDLLVMSEDERENLQQVELWDNWQG